MSSYTESSFSSCEEDNKSDKMEDENGKEKYFYTSLYKN